MSILCAIHQSEQGRFKCLAHNQLQALVRLFPAIRTGCLRKRHFLLTANRTENPRLVTSKLLCSDSRGGQNDGPLDGISVIASPVELARRYLGIS